MVLGRRIRMVESYLKKVIITLWIRDEHSGSYFRELINNYFGLIILILKSFMWIWIRDPKSFRPWIRDGKFGFGINIPDPQQWLWITEFFSLFPNERMRCIHKTVDHTFSKVTLLYSLATDQGGKKYLFYLRVYRQLIHVCGLFAEFLLEVKHP